MKARGGDGRGEGGEVGERDGRPRWVPVLEVGLGVAVVALVLAPVLAHPDGALAGTLDAPYHAWLGWRLAELWRHGSLLTLTIPDAFAPMGFDLRLVDGLFPAGVTAAFDLLTGGRMILSYNLALAVGVGLDLWAARRLAQVLSTRRSIWFACGVAFATAPALAGSLGAHIAFVYAFTLPLLVREAIVLARLDADRARVPWWVRVGLLLVLAYLCSSYHLIFGGLAFVLVLVAWPRSAVWSRATLVRVGGALAIALVVLSPFVAARLSYERDERNAGATDVVRTSESVAFSSDLLGAVTAPDTTWLALPVPRADLRPQLYPALRVAFFGYALLAGLIGVALVRAPARRPLLVATGVLWVLSLGPALHVAGRILGAGDVTAGADVPQWLPYRLLQAMPGLGALRAPTRASYAIAAVLTAALAVALDRAGDRLDARRADRGTAGVAAWAPHAGLVAGTVLLLACSLTAPVPTSDLGVSAETARGLAAIAARSDGVAPPGDALLIVPWGCRLDDPQVIALQSIHHRPNVGCNPPPTATRWFSDLDPWVRSKELAALRCDPSRLDQRSLAWDASVRLDGEEGLSRLRRDLGVRYVVIDEADLPSFGCDSVRDALPVLRAHEVVSDDGRWTIVDLARPAG